MVEKVQDAPLETINEERNKDGKEINKSKDVKHIQMWHTTAGSLFYFFIIKFLTKDVQTRSFNCLHIQFVKPGVPAFHSNSFLQTKQIKKLDSNLSEAPCSLLHCDQLRGPICNWKEKHDNSLPPKDMRPNFRFFSHFK